jgi:hypothetical protein
MSCLNPDALCVQSVSNTLDIFYNTHLIPLHVPLSQLRIYLFEGSATLNFNCSNPSSAIQSFPLNPVIVNERTNRTTLTIPNTNGRRTFLQLQDSEQLQCLSGPKLNGSFVPLVGTTITTRFSTPTMRPSSLEPTATTTANANTSGAFQMSQIWIMIGCGVVVGIMILVMLVVMRSKKEPVSSPPDHQNVFRPRSQVLHTPPPPIAPPPMARISDESRMSMDQTRMSMDQRRISQMMTRSPQRDSAMYLQSQPLVHGRMPSPQSSYSSDSNPTPADHVELFQSTRLDYFANPTMQHLEIMPEDSVSPHTPFSPDDFVPLEHRRRTLQERQPSKLQQRNRNSSFSSVETLDKFVVDFRPFTPISERSESVL